MKINSAKAPVRGETLFSSRIPSKFSWTRPLVTNLSKKLLDEQLIPDDESRTMVEVCFNEALTNAISHGNVDDPQRWVTVRLYRDGEDWGLVVGDQGRGFTVDAIPDPEAPDFPLRERGRGIFIMQHVMDRVEFYDSGRMVVLTKRVAPPEPAAAAEIPEGGEDAVHIAKVRRGIVARISLNELDESHVDAVFRSVRASVEEAEPSVLVVDLSGTKGLSSHAIGRLVSLQVTCARLGHELRLAGLGPALRGIFSAAFLDSVFVFFDTVEDAVIRTSGRVERVPS